MGRPHGYFAILALLLVIGVGNLARFSQNLFSASENVRTVDLVGLSGGGAACGAALFGAILTIVGRRRLTDDKKAPDKQLPTP